jgi:xanthine dehydrogenase accessory factor
MALAEDLVLRDRWAAAGKRVVAATVVSVSGSAPRPPGARLLLSSTGEVVGSVSSGCVEGDVIARAEQVMAGAPATVVTYGISDEQAFEVGLSCGGTIRVLIEAW